ncbi:glycosyltransferase family 2 protein [Patescibacteria group bacterium]|nr:glycosyltransferase family 2 protein [Patescibacteria group bacterium]
MDSYIINKKGIKNKFNKSVSLLCWAYNEEELIAEFLEKISFLMESTVVDYEIIFIEDGSTDKTYEIAKAFQKKNSRLKIFQNEKNLNVGISSRRAIKIASKKYLLWQTIDWSYDISNLRIFLEYLKRYDIVQGVRRSPVKLKIKVLKPIVAILKLFRIKYLTRRSDTIFKAIVSVINYVLIRILFGVPLSDFQNITIYPTKWIQSVEYESKSSFANPEGLIKSHWNGMSIKEVPIDFIPRKRGTAKGTKIKSIISSVKDVFGLWFKWIVLGKRKFIKKGKIYRLK